MLKRQDKQTVLVCPPFDCLISEQQMNGKRSVNLKISESQYSKSIIEKQKEYIEKLLTDNQTLISKIKQKDQQIKKLQSVSIGSQMNFKKLKESDECNISERVNSNMLQENNILREQIEKLKLVIKQYEYKLSKLQRNNLKMGSHLTEQIQLQEYVIQMSEVAVQTKTSMTQKSGQEISAQIQDQLAKVQIEKQKYESKYNKLKKKYYKLKQQMRIPRYLDQVEIQQEQHQYVEVQTQTNHIQKYQMPTTKNQQSVQVPSQSVQPSQSNKPVKVNQTDSDIVAKVQSNNPVSHSSITSQNPHSLRQNQQKIIELTQLSQKLQSQNACLKKTVEQLNSQLSSYTVQIQNQNAINQSSKASHQQNHQQVQIVQNKSNNIQCSLMELIFFEQQQTYLNNKFITPQLPLQSLDVLCPTNLQREKSLMVESIDRKTASNKLQINPTFFVEQQYRLQTFFNDQRLFKEMQNLSASNVAKILKEVQERSNRWIKYIQKQGKVDQSIIKGIQREIGCKKVIQYMLTLKDG